jgi:hypothetical protein
MIQAKVLRDRGEHSSIKVNIVSKVDVVAGDGAISFNRVVPSQVEKVESFVGLIRSRDVELEDHVDSRLIEAGLETVCGLRRFVDLVVIKVLAVTGEKAMVRQSIQARAW